MFSLSQFTAAPPLRAGGQIVVIGESVSLSSLDVLCDQYKVADWALLNAQYGNDVLQLHAHHVAIGHRVEEGPYKGNRSDARYAFLRECGAKGVPAAIAKGILLDRRFGISAAVLERRDAAAYADKEVGDAYADSSAQLCGDDKRPHILFDQIRLPSILDEIESALIAADAPIYQTGGRLVHPLRLDKASDEDGIRRSAGSLLLRDVSALRLREYCLENISFTRIVRGVEVPYAPPVSVANHFLAREDKWGIPVVRGIVETPTLRADGTLLTEEGYDRASELIVDLNGFSFPPIPEAPTKDEALTALASIKDVLAGFPFVPDDLARLNVSASRSVALSAIMTMVVRRTLRSAPLHGFSAPTMGTGKTLLADVVSMVGTGRLATAMSQGHDETEDEKRLLGVLMRSDPLLVIDNVHRPIEGDTLCTIMTQQMWQGRLLGENRQVHVPTNVLILATGNNLTVAGDMTTRTLISRLDAGIEKPETRRFDIDLKVEVPKRRPELVAAILTVLRAFIVAGRPGLDQLEPFGRFEDWSNLVRGALVWLGEPDPCSTRAFIAERDPVRADLVALVAAIEKGVGSGKSFVSGDVIKLSQEHSGLRQALDAIMPRGPSPKGLTRYLSGFDGRIVDGRCVRMSYDKHTKITWFRLETVEAQAQPDIPF